MNKSTLRLIPDALGLSSLQRRLLVSVALFVGAMVGGVLEGAVSPGRAQNTWLGSELLAQGTGS